jgi:hypothetical protein
MFNQIYVDESWANALLTHPLFSIPEPITSPNRPQEVYDRTYPQVTAAHVYALTHTEIPRTIAAILQETVQGVTDPDVCVLIRVEPSKTIAAILEKIDASVADPEMYDDNESHPTGDVVRGIKELVQRTEALLPGERLPTAIVRPFDGSIRITWVKESGSVRLAYSEKPVDRYIFHEEILGGRSYGSGVDRDPTPHSLASWLKWLNSR